MKRRTLLHSLAGAAVAGALPGWAARSLPEPSSPASPDGGQVIRLNQLGFLPSSLKRASVVLSGTDPQPFLLRDALSRQIVHHGVTSKPLHDEASGDSVAVADLSLVRRHGSYLLEVAGQQSDTFPVRDGVYAGALRSAMRGFYGQRCGCPVDLGSGYRHAACHADGGYHASSGRSGKLINTGGWHDAGDYGRYTVNSAIATSTLLWAWELYPDAFAGLHLGIPESGGRLPDFLAEVRWNLQWMLGMQDVDGGVWHKQTSEHFCGFVMPEADPLPSLVIGTGNDPYKSTGASAGFAATMAVAARCYRRYDPAFAARCLLAARQAYLWAAAHPGIAFRNPAGITTGEYGDSGRSGDPLWAAAELFRTTGEPAFERDFLRAIEPRLPTLSVATPSWSSVEPLALWTYSLTKAATSPAAKEAILAATAVAAKARVQRSRTSGYGNTLSVPDYIWGSNGVACNDAMLLLLAHRLCPAEGQTEAALANLDYLLGRNCFAISWLTGTGLRSVQRIHHRPSAADGIDAPWPGLLSGGPNKGGGDPVADALPTGPPMRRWIDDFRAYSVNEIAINWNAPLVFALAAANSRQYL